MGKDKSSPESVQDRDHDHRVAPQAADADVSRRGFLGGAAMGIATATAVGTGLMSGVQANADGKDRDDWRDNARDRDCPKSGHRKDRILLKGGIVLSLDPAVGDFAKADVLIEGKKIVAVAPNIRASAQVVDCSGMIVMPGMIDCHMHSWLGPVRGVIPNAATIGDYNALTHQGTGPHYRPQDMYVGNLFTALTCINAGVTCILDNSHNARTSAHSDAAIEALFDSGARAVHASGAPQFGTWDMQWPQDLVRIQNKYFASDDQLVTLRMFSGANQANWEFAKQLGLWITSEGGGGAQLATLAGLGLLDERHTFNHVNNVSEINWQLIRDAGATVNVTPRSDPQYGLGQGIPALQDALNHGMRPGLSMDNETSYAADMFTEMRVAFYFQRGLARNAVFKGDPNPPAPIKVRDMLEFATFRGAQNCALSHKIGTLTPGKEADVVLIRGDDMNTFPVSNAVGSVVSVANIGNVDTVIIGGQVRKWRGKLVGVNMSKVKRLVLESRAYLLSKIGLEPNIVA